MTIGKLLTILSLAVLSAGCGFTAKQRQIIGREADGIMQLVTVDDIEDSIFLRSVAQELSPSQIKSKKLQILKHRMLATVNDPANEGVGIAAPQVGLSYRLIAVQRFDKEDTPFGFYINPEITHLSEETIEGSEGCLSMPGYSGIVPRSKEITLTYIDENSRERVEEHVYGFTAVIFQHEIDHLNGILFTDKATSISYSAE